MVLIYKEVARDWLNDPLATFNRIEKVPIPVRSNKAQEQINEIDYDFRIFKIRIIVSCWKTDNESPI